MDDHQVAVRRDGNHKHTTKGDNIHMLLIRCTVHNIHNIHNIHMLLLRCRTAARYCGDNCFGFCWIKCELAVIICELAVNV